MSAAPPAVPSLDGTFGTMLLGTYIGVMLYGQTIHQAYRYTRLSPNDNIFLKLVVATVIAAETFHTAQIIHLAYWYLITNYFNPAALQNGVWSLDTVPVTAGVVILTSQLFFVRRVYMFGSKYRIVVVIVCFLLVTELAFLAAASIECFIQFTFAKFERVAWLVGAGFGVASLADAIITTALIITLRQSRTGFKRTDSIIEVIILYTVTTGLLTTIFNVLTFVFSIALKDSFLYIAFDFMASKLYASSLLAALNSRHSIAQKNAGGVSEVYGTGSSAAGGRNGTVVSNRLQVHVTTQRDPPTSDFAMDTDLVEFPPTKSDHVRSGNGYDDRGVLRIGGV